MKKCIITILAAILTPVLVHAQDDLYFQAPTKAEVKAKKEAEAKAAEEARKAEEKRLLELETAPASYYGGISKTDDEYNRRVKKGGNKIYEINEVDLYSKDSIASDVISFTPGAGVYPEDEARVDTVYKYIYVNDEDDYSYSRYLSRWDDFYWWHGGFGPYGYRYPLSWYTGWYDPFYYDRYSPWYDPYWYGWNGGWYGSWYDPWYYGNYYGYYDWYGYYGGYHGYNPHHHYPYTTYYPGGGGHIGGGGTLAHGGRTGGAPSGTANHAGSRRIFGNTGTNSNNAIARRNGDSSANHGGTRVGNSIYFGGNRSSNISDQRALRSSNRNSGSGYSTNSGYHSGSSYSSSSNSSSSSGSWGGNRNSSSSSSSNSSYRSSSSSSSSSSSGYRSSGSSSGSSGGGSFGGGSRSGGGGGGGHFGGGRR